MKTIFITISRGSIAKNILQTDIIKIIRASGARIVLLSPASHDSEFVAMFGGDQIFFEPLFEHDWSSLDRLFVGLHKALVYNTSTEMRDRYGIYKASEGSWLKYGLKKFFIKPLRNIQFLKGLVRWLDQLLIKDHHYAAVFNKYQPDAVFITNPIEDSDSYVMKQAHARCVPIIAMPKSWDNLPKISFRVAPEKLLVWGESMMEHVLHYQNMKRDQIEICGIPHFDIYKDSSAVLSREQFCSMIGADPSKALLVLGSEGKVTPQDPEIAQILVDGINNGKINRPAQLFIRPYFSLLGEEDKFKNVQNISGVIVDHWFKRSEYFRDHWDYSREQMIFFANLLRHADIMITHASTLMLDAAAFDKPVIGIGFDGYQTRPYGESSYRWYFSAHFQAVIDTKGSWIVRSIDECYSAINQYLANPAINAEGRVQMRSHFCYRIDGHSGERIGRAVINFLNR